MVEIPKIEYYDYCPKCGAEFDGSLICVCGGSFVVDGEAKNGEILIDARKLNKMSQEEKENRQREASYPVIIGKTCKGNILYGLCSSFAFILAAIYFFIMDSNPSPILCAIPMIIGVLMLISVIREIVIWIRCKFGQEITGVVRGYDVKRNRQGGNSLRRYFYVPRILIYEDGQPKIVCLNNGRTSEAYPIGEELKLKKNGNCYMIIEKHSFLELIKALKEL